VIDVSVKADPWQTAEIAGPKKALLILKPEVVAALVKRAKRPILVVGHLAAEEYEGDEKMIDYAVRLSRAAGIPVVATAHTIHEFVVRDLHHTVQMSAMDIGNRLKDAEWQGLDGKGSYDLALFMGLPYYMGFVILSGLKHFASELTTMCLDRFYNPHASWSFPNLSSKNWYDTFEEIVSKVGGN
jgi:acetyl-CoA decarbonylase/synthase complex subunit epsilon